MATQNDDYLPDALDTLILTEYPYPIAVNYKRMLDEQDLEKRTRACIQVFEFGLRAIALGLISQYLICDSEKVSDPQLNNLLLRRFSHATLGTWNEIFFKALQAYHDKRHLLFMPQLYDFYWDTSTSPHRPRKGIRSPFDKFVNIRNELVHGAAPRDEAGWQTLFGESFGLLRQILGHFTFLRHYDLVRVCWLERGGRCWYDIYTGQQVVSPSRPLTAEEGLTEGWLYLAKEDKRFLELHPLLVFWEKELVQAEKEHVRDAALFDRFRRTSLDYLATVAGERINLTDRTLIAEFVHTVYYNLEKVKMARREARKLTWALLKEVADKISAERVGDVRSKYRPEVYLQRADTMDSFRAFLASDKTCLVLIGKSGVGKSNFLLSLMDEYEESLEVCTLMYNGARLGTEIGMAEALAKDFLLHLKLEGLVEEGEIGDILFEINRIEGIADRKVVLLIDALNEHPESKALLRRVDALVEASPYPWLKVVISSRPETWRTIKRGLRLAEHKYYRAEQATGSGEHMHRFSIELEMKPFGRDELRKAYEKYQAEFQLQTDYDHVPNEVKHLLRDPLALWMIAVIFKGVHIGLDFAVTELYEKYVETLIDTERLSLDDVRFLERDLMPLMIGQGQYANSISGEIIGEAETRDGKSLFELINSDEPLGSGRRVNQSFANLVDAEILVELGTYREYQVAFRYERFYEYFGSRRLIELRDALPPTAYTDWYLEVAHSLTNSPFLWGPLRTFILLEAQSQNFIPALALAGTDSTLCRHLVISALEEYGLHEPDGVSAFVKATLRSSRLKPPLAAGLKPEEQRFIWTKQVAVTIAGHLLIEEGLLLALRSKDSRVRSAAVQETYRIWSEDPDLGLQILERLLSEMPAFYRPARYVIVQSLFDISMIILFQHFRDPIVMEFIRRMWQRIIVRTLYVDGRNPGALRNRLISLLISFGVRIIQSLGSNAEATWGPPGNLEEFAEFFRQDTTVKESLELLIPFLNPAHNSALEIKDNFLTIARNRDSLTMFITLLTIHGRAASGERLFDLVSLMTDVGLQARPPTPWAPEGVILMGRMIFQSTFASDANLLRAKTALLAYIRSAEGEYQTNANAYAWIPVGHYLAAYFHLYGQLDEEVVEVVSAFLHQTTNVDMLTSLAEQIAVPCEYNLPEASFAWLRHLSNDLNENTQKVKTEGMSQLYAHVPEDTEDLMDELGLSQSLRQQIRAQSVMKMRKMVYQGAELAVEKLALNATGSLFIQFEWWLKQALVCRNLREWLSLMIQGLINMLFGKRIFQIPQPPLGE